MVASFDVFDDWADPNRVEAHALDVIKVVFYTYVGSAAVLG